VSDARERGSAALPYLALIATTGGALAYWVHRSANEARAMRSLRAA